MLDKNTPYIGVLMTKDNPSEYLRVVLPEGYNSNKVTAWKLIMDKISAK